VFKIKNISFKRDIWQKKKIDSVFMKKFVWFVVVCGVLRLFFG